MFDAEVDCTRPVLIKWAEYDLKTHCQRMLAKHPQWTKRQTGCCRYWQAHVTAKLNVRVAAYVAANIFGSARDPGGLYVTYRPEALGVDVTATMKVIGVDLEWPPAKIVRKVVIIGSARENHKEST